LNHEVALTAIARFRLRRIGAVLSIENASDHTLGSRNSHNKEVADYYYHTLIGYLMMWTSRENLALHFGYYDGNPLSHTDALLRANNVLADAVGIMPGERVLDAGCGLGGSSFWLATYRRAIVAGIALGPDQIILATREANRRQLAGKCMFLVADFHRLPFPNECFDVVWAQESLCHSSTKSAFFQEAYRILRPGGRIVVADFFLRSPRIAPSDRVFMDEWLEGWKIPFLWTAAQHSNAAKAAAFSNISIKDVTSHTSPSHRRLYNITILARPMAVICSWLNIGNSFQHDTVIAAMRQYETLRRNCWFYAILSAQKPT
jgi:tocopherol O-methyltransferase